jgi:type IV secretory pathway TrbL component
MEHIKKMYSIICKNCKKKGINQIDALLSAASKSHRFRCGCCNTTSIIEEDSRLIFSMVEYVVWLMILGLAFYFLNYWIAILIAPVIAISRIIFVRKFATPIKTDKTP